MLLWKRILLRNLYRTRDKGPGLDLSEAKFPPPKVKYRDKQVRHPCGVNPVRPRTMRVLKNLSGAAEQLGHAEPYDNRKQNQNIFGNCHDTGRSLSNPDQL